MNKFMMLVILFIPTMLCADTYILNQIIDKAEKLYLRGENRENKILSHIVPEYSFVRRFLASHPQIIENMTEANIAAQLRACLFFTEGSYSEHLSDEQAEDFSREMAQYISTLENIRLYRIKETNIFRRDGQTPPCALGFMAEDSKGFLLMQGFYETP